ncbi:LysE family translocator [Pectobacterium aroidearum]|uniref:LysE family translocator n=1 Tax=Pectobacterium aroidearum TaxID=1201031 RepID=UPI0032EFBA00
MLELFIYVFSIMYTPGPVTTIAFNSGMNPRAPFRIGFATGVGVAMYLLLLVCGYSGQAVVNESLLPWISAVGGVYILYLAVKVILSSIESQDEVGGGGKIGFKSGFVIHLFNPKAWLAALPLVALYYPANNIYGWKLLFISTVIAVICGFSSVFYNLAGRYCSKLFSSGRSRMIINYLMGALLLYSGFMILYEHVYQPFIH